MKKSILIILAVVLLTMQFCIVSAQYISVKSGSKILVQNNKKTFKTKPPAR